MATLSDIMTPNPETISPDLSLRDAAEFLRSRGFSGVPVVAGSRVRGVLSASDLLEFAAAHAREEKPANSGEAPSKDYWDSVEEWALLEEDGDPSAFFRDLWPDGEESVDERWDHADEDSLDALAEHSVAEIMTRSVCALPPGAEVRAAAAYLVEKGIHRVLVMEGDVLLGIVSTMDIVRAVAQGQV